MIGGIVVDGTGGGEIRLFRGGPPGALEGGGPPGTVRGEIEFQVAAGCGVREEKFRDIGLPESRGEPTGEGARERCAGGCAGGDEPQRGMIHGEGPAERRIERQAGGIRSECEKWKIEGTP